MSIDGTTPYPWPYDGPFDLQRCVLVVTGWDEHLWDHVPWPDTVLDHIEALASVVPTITVAHGAGGHAAAPARPAPAPTARSMTCAGIDAFFGSALDATLRAGRWDHLLLAGLGLETTVHSTMRSANDRGYECLLVIDACAPLDPSLSSAAVSMIEMSGGIFGAIGTTAACLAAIAAASNHLSQGAT
jgi:biuret amidohydrolase